MKIYEYKGKIYCEEDLSLENEDYVGDLFDLYWELNHDGKADENTVYYATEEANCTYDSAETLVEEEFSDLVIGEKESEAE